MRVRVIRYVSALLIAVSIGTAVIVAGEPPNLLDDNRDNLALEALETTVFNAALAILGFFNPISPAFTYPPVVIDGRVLSHPKIHNLYLDDDWNAHNPDAPTKEQLDAFTQELAGSGYLSEASQYGVGSATFTGSHERSVLCAPLEPIGDYAEFVELLAWTTCMTGFSPLPVPGLLDPYTGVPKGDDDSLYVVYLPRNVQIVEGGCDSFNAYHFFAAVPDIDFILFVPYPRSQTVAFAVVATACAKGTGDVLRNNITRAATHEIIEAATDPLVATGWINNSIVTEGDSFWETLVNSFSNIGTDLRAGEAADICSKGGTLTGPPAYQMPTEPIPVPASDPSLGGSYLVAPYWSNQHGKCAPFVPTTDLTLGTPSYGSFVASATPLTIEATDGGSDLGVASISYRVYADGTTPPDFTTQAPPVELFLTGADGKYFVEMFATGNNGMVEVAHKEAVFLDNSAPNITIVEPTATQYPHSAVLTLNYSANDGAGSGVASVTASLDGSTTLNGHGLASGQSINLLLELPLGPHSFSVEAVDRVNNEGVSSVTFEIVVTPESIMQDVQILLDAGMIKDPGLPTALLAKLDAAAKARADGKCAQAASLYEAFISLLEAQYGTGVDVVAADIMIADAEYLIAHCP